MKSTDSEKVRLIHRYFSELWNAGRIELVPELLGPSYVNHSPGTPDMPVDRSGVAGIVQAMRAAFPDLHYRIEDVVDGEDAVAVRLTVTGTHTGNFFGIPPSGKSFRVEQINIERFAGGQIVAHHRLTNDLSLLRQLGVVAG